MKVISNKQIALETYEMILDATEIPPIKAGQFLHLKTGREDLLLRRPISVASYTGKEAKLVYKVIGEGTKALTEFAAGDRVDSLGPLGNGFEEMDFEDVLIVGGGMGVAPLYQLGKELVDKGSQVTFVLGFGSAEMAYYVEKFESLGRVILTTDDGSAGIHGNAGDGLSLLEDRAFDAIYACGPFPLLRHLLEVYEEHPHVYVSLEERMACGIGACYACDTKDKKNRVCVDGPVFNKREVEI